MNQCAYSGFTWSLNSFQRLKIWWIPWLADCSLAIFSSLAQLVEGHLTPSINNCFNLFWGYYCNLSSLYSWSVVWHLAIASSLQAFLSHIVWKQAVLLLLCTEIFCALSESDRVLDLAKLRYRFLSHYLRNNCIICLKWLISQICGWFIKYYTISIKLVLF